MIQIDDSGSGSLIGGTCIGAMRIESGEYEYDFVPIEFYRDKVFQSKKYLKKCSEIVFSLLERLSYTNGEPLEICQGYMFEAAKKDLEQKGIAFISTKIGDPLQSKIEETFQDYAMSLGLPLQYVKYTRFPLHFHRILRWVYADFKKRAPLCKTGWKSWKKYSKVNIEIKRDILYKSNYICLKCGMEIAKGSRVKRLEYISNCPNIIYLHESC
jgi:hypothetical protein